MLNFNRNLSFYCGRLSSHKFVRTFLTDMLHQWHAFVEQMHTDDGTMAVDGMTNLSIGGAATPINMMTTASMMGPPNDVIGYGTLRSSGGQMFDALSDKVTSLKCFYLSKSSLKVCLYKQFFLCLIFTNYVLGYIRC